MPGAQLVPREQLVSKVLSELDQVRVVTITGAAGIGKSILMGQLHERLSQARRSCWVNFDEDDNVLINFFTYFLAGLQSIDSKLGARANGLINADAGMHSDEIFQILSEDISAVSLSTAIFLDDCHFLTNPMILTGLNRFFAALSPEVVLVLTSRSEVGLELSRRRISGSLKEVGQRDLSFSTQETQQLLSHTHRVVLSVQEAETLNTLTEGWAAGLQMAGLALKKSDQEAGEFISNYSGADRELGTYLMESVFRIQCDEIKKFLLFSSPLRKFNAELCVAATGLGKSRQYIEQLYNENMFLIPLDNEGKWYRYHQLFSEFLQQELLTTHPNAAESVSEAASSWCVSNHLSVEAVRYLLAAKQHDRAAELIAVEGARVAQGMGDHETILNWMHLLPEEFQQKYPQIKLQYAWTLLFTRSARRSEEIADEVCRELDQWDGQRWNLSHTDIEMLRCQTDVIRAISYNARDEAAKARRLIEASIRKWKGSDDVQLAALYSSLAYSCIESHEFDEGFAAASTARLLSSGDGANYMAVWANWASALLSLEKGLLNDAESYLDEGQKRANRLTGEHSHGKAMITLAKAELFCDRGEVAAAEVLLSGFVWLDSYFAPLEPLFTAFKTQARALVANDSLGVAVKLLREGQQLGLSSQLPRLTLGLASEELKLHLRKGSLDDAIAQAHLWGFRKAPASAFADERELAIPLHLKREMEARLLLRENRFEKSLRILSGLINEPSLRHSGRLRVELRALRSIVFWRLNRKREAMRELAVAIAEAAPNNLRLPFLDIGEDLADILEAIREQRSVVGGAKYAEIRGFEDSILTEITGIRRDAKAESVSETAAEKTAEVATANALTPKELEILRLLAEGLSTRETAETLFVTIPTIKWHMQNVFEKFGVRTRAAVLARARTLNLLE